MKINMVKVIKVGSLVASVVGMIGSGWAAGQENKDILKELVAKELNK